MSPNPAPIVDLPLSAARCRFFEHQIHWFSIFNSFMMVIFLCGLVALILMRTLRQDYAKVRSDRMRDGVCVCVCGRRRGGWVGECGRGGCRVRD